MNMLRFFKTTLATSSIILLFAGGCADDESPAPATDENDPCLALNCQFEQYCGTVDGEPACIDVEASCTPACGVGEECVGSSWMVNCQCLPGLERDANDDCVPAMSGQGGTGGTGGTGGS